VRVRLDEQLGRRAEADGGGEVGDGEGQRPTAVHVAGVAEEPHPRVRPPLQPHLRRRCHLSSFSSPLSTDEITRRRLLELESLLCLSSAGSRCLLSRSNCGLGVGLTRDGLIFMWWWWPGVRLGSWVKSGHLVGPRTKK
jgi:hypothetical protein